MAKSINFNGIAAIIVFNHTGEVNPRTSLCVDLTLTCKFTLYQQQSVFSVLTCEETESQLSFNLLCRSINRSTTEECLADSY